MRISSLVVVAAFSVSFFVTPIASADAGPHSKYKHEVATRVLAANKMHASKAGYKAISVVGYTIDRSGALTESWIVRSSGDQALDSRALASFHKAAPLPQPPAGIFGVDPTASLSEAFVFATDGSFKLQSLTR